MTKKTITVLWTYQKSFVRPTSLCNFLENEMLLIEIQMENLKSVVSIVEELADQTVGEGVGRSYVLR